MSEKSVRFLHLADIHLGAENQQLPEDKQAIWTEQIWQSFEQIIRETIHARRPIQAVLISGDLFDSPNPAPTLVEKTIELFAEVEAKGIPILLVPGNHDNIISPDSVYHREKFPAVVLLESPGISQPFKMTFSGIPVHFYGMAYSFLSEPPFDEFRPEDPEAVNIALIHGSVVRSTEWALHAQEVPLNVEKLFRTGFHYLALGHYHNFQHWEQDERHIVYPGTLEPLSWKETGERKIVILEVEPHRVLLNVLDSYHQRRRYLETKLDCQMHGIDSEDGLIQHLCEKYRHPSLLFHVRLHGQCVFIPNLEKIRQRCQEQFFFFKITDETQFVSREWLERFREEKTIRGMAIRELLRMESTAEGEEKVVVQEALKILSGYFTSD